MKPKSDGVRKLGLLGGTFEDGSLCIFSVPDPEDVRSASDGPPHFREWSTISRVVNQCSYDARSETTASIPS